MLSKLLLDLLSVCWGEYDVKILYLNSSEVRIPRLPEFSQTGCFAKNRCSIGNTTSPLSTIKTGSSWPITLHLYLKYHLEWEISLILSIFPMLHNPLVCVSPWNNASTLLNRKMSAISISFRIFSNHYTLERHIFWIWATMEHTIYGR